MSHSVIWLIAGVVMIAAEAFAVPGIGFLFAGLAALIVGILTYTGVAVTLTSQLAWMCGLTVLWAVVLWKPLKNFYTGKKRTPYNNIVGTTAVVTSQKLYKDRDGQVKWSGTIMTARISPEHTSEEILSSTEVIITEVIGNTVYVKTA